MDDTAVKVFTLLLLIRNISCDRKGFVSEVLADKKFNCPSTTKKVYTVKSEIQCTHRCLQSDNCELLNYNTEEDINGNCEIFSQSNGCSTELGKGKWKAMRFQVCMSIIVLELSSFLNSLLRAILQGG